MDVIEKDGEQYVRLSDYERTEAARLAAEEQIAAFEIYCEDQAYKLDAERALAEKLIDALKEISTMSADDDLIEVAIEVATDAIAAYQSSKENGE